VTLLSTLTAALTALAVAAVVVGGALAGRELDAVRRERAGETVDATALADAEDGDRVVVEGTVDVTDDVTTPLSDLRAGAVDWTVEVTADADEYRLEPLGSGGDSARFAVDDDTAVADVDVSGREADVDLRTGDDRTVSATGAQVPDEDPGPGLRRFFERIDVEGDGRFADFVRVARGEAVDRTFDVDRPPAVREGRRDPYRVVERRVEDGDRVTVRARVENGTLVPDGDATVLATEEGTPPSATASVDGEPVTDVVVWGGNALLGCGAILVLSGPSRAVEFGGVGLLLAVVSFAVTAVMRSNRD